MFCCVAFRARVLGLLVARVACIACIASVASIVGVVVQEEHEESGEPVGLDIQTGEPMLPVQVNKKKKTNPLGGAGRGVV